MDFQSTIDVLSRTIYGEARNQSEAGMAAVAWVVLNRAKNPRWWGKDVISVCMCPWQFSCWNAGDPNRAIILHVDSNDSAYREACRVSQAVLNGDVLDPTDGADSYFAATSKAPSWSENAVFTVQIGAHRFYRVELRQPDEKYSNKKSAF